MTRIDIGRVRERGAYLRTQVQHLRALAARTDAETFGRDALSAAAARYLLQTSIEALIDLAYHLSAKLAQHAPRDAHDAFETMGRLGILDAEGMPRRHEMLRFRNRIVHRYLDVDDRRIHAMICGPELEELLGTLDALERSALGAAAKNGSGAAEASGEAPPGGDAGGPSSP